MPVERTVDYFFGGSQQVLIYTEVEMAAALRVSVDELHRAIKAGYLSYHAHPAPSEGYLFNQGSYDSNIARYNCLAAGGHFWRWDRYYDQSQGKSVWGCPFCMAQKYE